MMTLLQITNDIIIATGIEQMVKISAKIGARLLIDMATVLILVRFIYYPIYKHRELFFTFFIFNLIIFLISFLLNKVDLSMGAAFGLFAVFSMLRYKTESISLKNMTYLFLSIAIGLISAVTKIKDTPDFLEYLFLGGINSIILLITYLLESKLLMKTESVKTIVYEKIELIQADKEAELLADIRNRTGMNVHRLTIEKIDFSKTAVEIKVYYYEG